jgi:hypothetical protein
MPRKLKGREILGILLQRAGRGVEQYYDLKQFEEQKKLRAEDRDWIKTVRGWRKEDRQRDIAQAKREQEVKQRAASFLKILGGDSPFAPEIPDVNIRRQKAYDVIGETAPRTVGAGALKEHLIRAGEPESVAELARLKELGIAPEKPDKPSASQEDRARWVQLSLRPDRDPAEELEYQSLNKTYGNDKAAQSEVEKHQKKLEKSQIQWDKDYDNYIKTYTDQFPMHTKLIKEQSEGKMGGVSRLIIASWSGKDQGKYRAERVRLHNILGPRPEKIEPATPDIDPLVLERLRGKYSEEEIREATK